MVMASMTFQRFLAPFFSRRHAIQMLTKDAPNANTMSNHLNGSRAVSTDIVRLDIDRYTA